MNILVSLCLNFILGTVCISSVICDDCLERDTCEKNKNMPIPACYCDQRCFQYNDCCKEFLESNNHDNESVKSTNESCVLLTNYKRIFAYRAGAYMIEKCLTTGDPCKAEDGNLSSLVPVTHGGKTYRNAFCAICNDVTDYKFWNIIFHVMNDDEIVTVSEDGDLIQNENVLKNIKDISSSTQLHFLRPPAGSVARFCPYDLLKKSDDNDNNFNDANERVKYLNPTACKGTMFRNIDACHQEGCCKSSVFSCIKYNAIYMDGDHNSQNESSRGANFKAVEIVLKFTPSTTGKSDFIQVEDMDLSMTYLNQKVDTIVELMTDDHVESIIFDDCFKAVNVYLSVTHGLKSSKIYYVKITVSESVCRGYFSFRSTSRQTAQEITQLLRLSRLVRCEVGNDGKTLVGALRPMTEKDAVDARRYKRQMISLTSNYNPAENMISPLCQNVSIGVLTKPGSSELKFVDMECLDETTIKNDTNSGQNEACAKVTKILLGVFIAWLFVI